jgi:hypothetical protein
MSSQSPSGNNKHMVVKENISGSVFQTPLRNGITLLDNRSLLADLLSSNSLARGRDSGQKYREVIRTPTIPSSISEILQNLAMSPSTNFLYHSPGSLEKYVDSFSRERINVLKLMKWRHTHSENNETRGEKTDRVVERSFEASERIDRKDKSSSKGRNKENSERGSKINSNDNSGSKSVTSESEISLATAKNIEKIVESLFTERVLAKKNLMNMFDNESLVGCNKNSIEHNNREIGTCKNLICGEKEILSPTLMKRKTPRTENSESVCKEKEVSSPQKENVNLNSNIQQDYKFLNRGSLIQSNNPSTFKELMMNSPIERRIRKVSTSSYNFLSESKSAYSPKKKIIFCSEKKNPSHMNTSAKSSSSEFSTDRKERKRLRKSSDQLKFLRETYEENHNKDWTKEMITEISNMVGLPENKVYKWFWDKKNKEMREKKVFYIESGRKESSIQGENAN